MPEPIFIPPHLMPPLESPGFAKRQWNSLVEWWYVIWGDYFIERSIIKKIEHKSETGFNPVMEIEKTDYYNLYDRKFYKSPENATCVGYFMGAVAVISLKRKNRNPQYEFSLISLGDLAFMNHVLGEEKAGKEDFR